jgi:hypothetical protein
LHTAQLHPITGTPCDVPVPKNVTFIGTNIQKEFNNVLLGFVQTEDLHINTYSNDPKTNICSVKKLTAKML